MFGISLITDLISLLAIGLFRLLFVSDLVLKVLGIYIFLLGCPIYWLITVHNIPLCLYFSDIICDLFFNFLFYLLDRLFFSMNLATYLLILFIFFKTPALSLTNIFFSLFSIFHLFPLLLQVILTPYFLWNTRGSEREFTSLG